MLYKIGAILAASIFLFSGQPAKAQDENIDKIQQPLVGGRLVNPNDQEAFGLLTLANPSGTCSASMLNRYWAITAAHCVFSSTTGAAYTPGQITLSATWPGQNLSTQVLRVVPYATTSPWKPIDIALLQTSGIFGRPDYRDRKLHDARPMGNQRINAFGRGISQLAFGSGATATPTVSDRLYRSAEFDLSGIRPNSGSPDTFFYAGRNGAIVAGGDSGGPSFVQEWDNPNSPRRKLEWRLLGVHSSCQTTCLAGQNCTSANPWRWVAAISTCEDAAVWNVRESILATIEEVPTDTRPIGTFPPPGSMVSPAFIYVVNADGRLVWLRHDGSERGDGLSTPGAWVGSRPVGRGWEGMTTVFGGGGNSIYGIDGDGLLKWYQHNGFNTGAGVEDSSAWVGPKDVGRGWGGLQHVFPGGNGIIYTIAEDGILRWLKHNGFRTGAGLEVPGAWEGPKDVGRGWGGLKHVFSGGDGIIYTISDDGILRWLKHNGFRTGAGLTTPGAWEGPKDVGRGWANLKHVFPGRDGIIYTISDDGILRWLKHNGFRTGAGLTTPGAWTGPKDVGRGWGEVLHVFALMPSDPPPVR